MRNIFFGKMRILAFLILVSFSTSGCIWILFGGAAAAGGYAISQDTIQGETEKSFDEVWEAVSDVMTMMGTIESESYELGQVKGIVNGARITVSILQLTPSTVRIKVKGRKFIFPSISNAQTVFIKVMNKVNRDL